VDKRIVFLLVFLFTLVSTILVLFVCIATEQKWLTTVLYTLATMWLVGVLSQLLIQHLYLSIVKPIDDAKFEKNLKEQSVPEIDLEELEEIDQVVDSLAEKETTKV